MSRNFKKIIIFGYKILLYILLFCVFFFVFSIRNVGLRNVSRTMVITMVTFMVLGAAMLVVYGDFKIGEEKSKPVFCSTLLAVIMTDLFTYLQLMIMNTNPSNNIIFELRDLDLLIMVFLVQGILIWIFTYIGNLIYFKLFSALDTVIVYDQNEEASKKVMKMIDRHCLQYNLIDVKNAYDTNLYDSLLEADYVILLDMSETRREEIVKVCYHHQIRFSFLPTVASIVQFSGVNTSFDDIPMVDVNVGALSIEQKVLKRIIDVFLSTLGILVTAPIMLVIAALIKYEDGGKVFFIQERYTINHKIFKVVKFRSMKENVDNYSATENDQRITKVGKIIRKTRLDELPQFFNILLGQMSFVGPRPEMLENVHQYEASLTEFEYRLRVKAGLTGIAQIEGKYNTTPEDKLLMDLTYIQNYSLWTDFKIIFKTVTVFFKKDSTQAFNKKVEKHD